MIEIRHIDGKKDKWRKQIINIFGKYQRKYKIIPEVTLDFRFLGRWTSFRSTTWIVLLLNNLHVNLSIVFFPSTSTYLAETRSSLLF